MLLNSTRNEIVFYRGKLTTLSEKFVAAIENLKQNKSGIILPSFSLYPEFLERLKIELNSFFQNDSIVQEVSHCHFELCHVLERLNWVKGQTFREMLDDLQNRKATILNLDGIQRLIESSIAAFEKAASKLDEEIKTVSSSQK